MLRSRKYITNNIRRYTHTHNSPSSNKKLDITVDEKLNKIMSKLEVIDILVKFNYALAVLPGLLYFFK
jgi:chromatin remodeling complex protein RSC6